MSLSSKILVGAVLVPVLASGALVSSLYTKTWDPDWNPFRPSPQQLIQKAIEFSNNLQSSRSSFEVNAEFENPEGDVYFLAEGTTERVGKITGAESLENIRQKGELTLDLTIVGISLKGDFEWRQIGKTYYLKVSRLPVLSLVNPELENRLSSVWIRYNPEEKIDLLSVIQEISDNYGVSLSPQDLEELERLQKEWELSQQTNQKIMEKWTSKLTSPQEILGLLKNPEIIGTDVINKRPVYKVRAEIDAEKTGALIEEYLRESFRSSLQNKDIDLTDSLESSISQVKRALDFVARNSYFIFYIDKKTYAPYKTIFELEIADLSRIDPESRGGLKLEASFVAEEFNPSLEITAPTESKNWVEFLGDFIYLFLPTPDLSSPEGDPFF